jgi:hypothetical protein
MNLDIVQSLTILQTLAINVHMIRIALLVVLVNMHLVRVLIMSSNQNIVELQMAIMNGCKKGLCFILIGMRQYILAILQLDGPNAVAKI